MSLSVTDSASRSLVSDPIQILKQETRKESTMYPFSFRPSRKGINHREVFVVMPFDPEYDCVFHELIEKAVSIVAD